MNPTPSQPMPEPPEGYRMHDPSIRLLPEDALIKHKLFKEDTWDLAEIRGQFVNADFFNQWWVATRTPAPEAVAGERKPHCPFCGNLPRIQTWCEDDGSKHLICCQHIQSKVFDNEAEAWIWWAQRATPPVEADKDTEIFQKLNEIAQSGDENHGPLRPSLINHIGTVTGIYERQKAEIARLRKELKEESDNLFKASELLIKYEDQLTTARATIAERDKRIEALVGALKKLLKLGKNCEGDIGWRGNPDAVVDYIRVKHILLIEAALAHAAEGKEQA